MLQRPLKGLRRKYAEDLLIEAKKGLMAGLPVYGDYHPDTDPRNMLHEAQEEIVDAYNYNDMDLQRYPGRHQFHQKMRAIYLAAYIALREEEEERTPKGG